MILDDYYEALNLASTPLRESITRFRRLSEDQWLTTTLERIQVGDPEDAIARVRNAMTEYNRKNQAEQTRRNVQKDIDDAWTERMVEATRTLDQRLNAIRQRVESEQAAIESTDITRDQLVRMAQ